ncbi:hypothetical protein NDN08_008070 [Rhodosorus marinus]|uniref:Glycosyltransferase 2-like domain-containing protein n=1 Tax=Rhodosorus marinus TaxID=101924 RepID=A0AAV8UZA8_9RHOD|nr:hypothetical protein NDN08_008070 [Rhodosorus marinus]
MIRMQKRKGNRKENRPEIPLFEDPNSKSKRRRSSLKRFLNAKTLLALLAIVGAVVAAVAVGFRFRSQGTRTAVEADLSVTWYSDGYKGNRNLPRSKIVALVEVRNVRNAVPFFLTAISRVVDSVVVLDDHSEDNTVGLIEDHHEHKVEVLLKKTGPWKRREEMRDRNILLEYGRKAGGTHFVLLDYDEFFSANCVRDGSLRERILQLKPGESLNLPWLEAWKSPFWHRVLEEDFSTNFLERRQTVIFADDGKVMYNTETSLSRDLGEQNASIHTLKCPRNLCGTPPKNKGRGKQGTERCKIIEMKFASIENAILKSAWYEALGRRANVPDATVRGKIFDALFHPSGNLLPKEHIFPIPRDLVINSMWKNDMFSLVESWRAREVLKWGRETPGGLRTLLEGLPASASIDWDALEELIDEEDSSSLTLPALPRARHGRVTYVLHDALPKELLEHILVLLGPVDQDFLDSSARLAQTNTFPDRLDEERHIRNTLISSLHGSNPRERLVIAQSVKEGQGQSFEVGVNLLQDVNVEFVLLVGPEDESRPTSHVRQLLKELVEKANVFHHLSVVGIDSTATLSLSYASAALEALQTRRLVVLSEVIESAMRTRASLLNSKWIPESNLPKLADMVFSVNAGRSGSRYLADLLGTVEGNVVSLHEPACPEKKCSSGGAMRMQNTSLPHSYRNRKDVKYTMILKELETLMRSQRTPVSASRGWGGTIEKQNGVPLQVVHWLRGHVRLVNTGGPIVYIETNPNFKSWYYDIVLREFGRNFQLTIINLRKWPPALLRSIYETGFFSDRDGYQWMETANSVNSKTPAIAPDYELTPLQLINSYILNTEAVAQEISKFREAESVTFLNLRSEEVFSKSASLELVRTLGLKPSNRTFEILGVVRDKYRDENHRLRSDENAGTHKLRLKEISLADCEKSWKAYLARASSMGLELPKCVDRYPGFDYGK